MRSISAKGSSPRGKSKYSFPLYALLLVGILAVLFGKGFLPGFVHFSKDTPLGAVKPVADNLGECVTGRWSDLNSIGVPNTPVYPCISAGLTWLIGGVGFAKFAPPFALLVLGLCAWILFRQLKLSALACVLGGLAAALNLAFASTACWGVVGQPIAFGTSYLALAAIVNGSQRGGWARAALAGVAVGLGILEGLDVGALFSLVVAAFVLYHALVTEPGAVLKRLGVGALKIVVVALFAASVSFGLVRELIRTQITSVAGMSQASEAKQQRWNWAVQWSTPKREILTLAVPGLFGYRMDRDAPDDLVTTVLRLAMHRQEAEGWNYWGAGGRDPAWDEYFAGGEKGPPPSGLIRFGGGGGYAGLLVLLLAIWAGAQAMRGQSSVFGPLTRKLLWFWLGLMLVALVLALGRYTPIYGLFYSLPYSSTIRNPAKFGHVFVWGLVVLFAYGVHGLTRRYLEIESAPYKALQAQLTKWWSQVKGFDRKWIFSCLAILGLSLIGWVIYAACRSDLERYLETVQFDAQTAKAIAGFSISHVGWFILRLTILVLLLTLVFSGWFGGRRARLGGFLLGTFLVLDLAAVDRHWILFWDADVKYSSNPIIDRLRDRAYEHRMAISPVWLPQRFGAPQAVARAADFFDQLYTHEWLQHLFQYYGIQSLDVSQMPRVPADLQAFDQALQERPDLVRRRWQLTNTRYLLGVANLLDILNHAFDPDYGRFRILTRFHLRLKEGVSRFSGQGEQLTAVPSTNGTYALFEFTGALPRASLYTHWEVSTNDQATLARLADASFDPEGTVLVSSDLARPSDLRPGRTTTNWVSFTAYKPRQINLRASAGASAVLLLNDKFDPNWTVTLDGKPAALLRCNYVMRGVQVPPGEHDLEFRFDPPFGGLYVNIAALLVGILLAGFVMFQREPEQPSGPASPASALKLAA